MTSNNLVEKFGLKDYDLARLFILLESISCSARLHTSCGFFLKENDGRIALVCDRSAIEQMLKDLFSSSIRG